MIYQDYKYLCDRPAPRLTLADAAGVLLLCALLSVVW